MSSIKVGLVGYGSMGGYHMRNLSSHGGYEVVAVLDIDPARNEAARRKWGVPTYATLKGFLAHAGLELVVIATPNDTHREISVNASLCGMNVVVEKPAALNSMEVREMADAAKAAGKIFTVHHNRRWDADYRSVCRTLSDGIIGKPRVIESRVMGFDTITGWRAEPNRGGGMLYDWGSHLVDQLLMMVGSKPRSVSANLLFINHPLVDDHFEIKLVFEDGTIALATMSQLARLRLPRWYIVGENGILKMDWFDTPGQVASAEHPEPQAVAQATTDYLEYWTQLKGAIRNGTPAAVSPNQVIESMGILDAARLSSNSNTTVRL